MGRLRLCGGPEAGEYGYVEIVMQSTRKCCVASGNLGMSKPSVAGYLARGNRPIENDDT